VNFCLRFPKFFLIVWTRPFDISLLDFIIAVMVSEGGPNGQNVVLWIRISLTHAY
jgi:hypothetical protein